METIIANAVGKVRREVLHGRTYWVAPTTIIKGDAVLNGSKGPLFYPKEEQQRDPGIWNMMPLVVQHPMRDGMPVSARDPVILEESMVGNFYRATFNGDSVGESWFDEELTKKADRKLSAEHRMLPRLMRGEAIEQSTGVFTDNVPVGNGKAPNGTQYTHIARNYRADHIAVLPDRVGACSVKDGCGINPTGNESGTRKNDSVDGPIKTKLVKSKRKRLRAMKDLEADACVHNAEGVCINCGGKGGKPGPCKMVTDDDRVHQASKEAYAHSVKVLAAAKSHMAGSKSSAYRFAKHAKAASYSASWFSKNAATSAEHAKSKELHEDAAKIHDQAAEVHEYDAKHHSTPRNPQHEEKRVAALEASTSMAKLHRAAAAGHRFAAGLHNDRSLETNHDKGDTNVDRIATINYLTTNCDCWKGTGDKALLEAMPDAKLKQLEASAKGTTNNSDLTNNSATPVKLTFAQMLQQHATPEEQAVWNSAVQVAQRERVNLVERIVSSITQNEEQKKALRPLYEGMNTAQLQAHVAALPAPTQCQFAINDANNPFAHLAGASYVGNGQTVNGGNGRDYDEDDVLPMASVRSVAG